MIRVAPHWAELNAHLIELLDLVPDDQLDRRPAPDAWGIGELMQHIVAARNHWLANALHDGGEIGVRSVTPSDRSKIRTALRDSFARIERFVSDPALLEARYEPPAYDDPLYVDPDVFDGHYVAFHRLVHDVHHRADVMHRLNALDIALPPDRRRRPL